MSSICRHERTEHISGDLICLMCGKVIHANSLLSAEPSVADLLQDSQKRSKLASIPVQLKSAFTHEAKSLAELRSLASNLITAFALKSSYEQEALNLMTKFWDANKSNIKFGKSGNRLLVTCLFLLARRDRLAVNFESLAESIQSNRFECGRYVNPVIQIDPNLRTLADPVDFAEHEIVTLLSLLTKKYGLVIAEAKIHELSCQAIKIASLASDSGSSSSSQSIALAAVWIVLDAFLHSDMELFDRLIEEKAIEQTLTEIIHDNSSLSLRNVINKRKALITTLLELGKSSMPATFGNLVQTKPRLYSLLLSSLDELLLFVQK